METKTKVFIFDKKELLLILVFMMVVAITSFAIGVRVGRAVIIRDMGITAQDRQEVELKAALEEKIDEVTHDSGAYEDTKETGQKEFASTYQKLEEEFKRISDFSAKDKSKDYQDTRPAVSYEKKGKIRYTIQLGAYKSNQDAIKFADGFRVRGYNPIVSEVKLNNDRWYRVGLGIFENVLEAKNYIENEESLFQGQDYIITELE